MSRQNQQQPLDTSIRIVTPENIAFSYRVAGPFQRLLAYLVDMTVLFGIQAALWISISVVTAWLGIGGIGIGLLLTLSFLLWWFYHGYLEAVWNGQTVGKRLFRLRVVSDDGRPINAWQAVLRNLARVVDFLPFFYQVGLVAAACNSRFQRVGDLVCGTMVVVEEKRWLGGHVQFRDSIVSRCADQIPAGFRPSPSLARALTMYVEKRHYLSPPRRLEIANHIATALLDRFQMSPKTNTDLLLCALYHRTFTQST